MRHRPSRRAIALRRLLLLAASCGLGATGWFLLGESEPPTVAETPQPVLARVAGVGITVGEVTGLAADGLAELARQRRELILETTRAEVHRRLLEAEAGRRGITPEDLLAIEVAGDDVERYDALIARLERSYGVEYLLDASPAGAAVPGDPPTRIAGYTGR